MKIRSFTDENISHDSIPSSVRLLSPLEENQESYKNDFLPKRFSDYIGQKIIKERIYLHIASAKKRDVCLDHILLFGPPGLGKTTFATIIAQEMEAPIKYTSGPVLQKSGDLVALLSHIKKNTVIFIDEIHRLPLVVEEVLYSAMEEFKVDIIVGEGVNAKSISLPLQAFTLIGATTKSGLLSAPLRSRFGIAEKFDWYTVEELSFIVMQSFLFYNIKITHEAAYKIASVSRYTPRIAKKISRRIRDFIVVNKGLEYNEVTEDDVQEALLFFGIREWGLTAVDIKILSLLYRRKDPLGLETLSILTGEEAHTIEDVYEPFLLQEGFIERTPRGRIISPLRYTDTVLLIEKYQK